jgi:predicted transcriptional regulator
MARYSKTVVMAVQLLVMASAVVALLTDTGAAEGREVPGNVILIHNISELQNIDLDLNASYALANDIDASSTKNWNGGKGFEPIGNDSGTHYDNQTSEWDFTTAFNGSFDGRGHNITGLWMDRAETGLVGLFGLIDGHSRISNLSLVSAEISGRTAVGGIVGSCNFSTVTNCHFNGTIKQGGNMGGIVGETYFATITYCTFNGRIDTRSYYNGGIVGNLWVSTVANCSSSGTLLSGEIAGGIAGQSAGGGIFNCHSDVSIDGDMSTGGIVGINGGIISNCYSTGPLHGERNYLGGIAATNGGTIANCSSTGPVGGGALYVGGLVGENQGTISNCSASGNVYANYRDTGGLVGRNVGGRISDCYSIGPVIGNCMVGGLVGENLLDTIWNYQGYQIVEYGTITDSYSTGMVSGVNDTGGLVAYNEGIVNSSYWDIPLSNCATSAGGIGKNLGELMKQATFEGWDFAGTWDIQEGVRMPFLRKFNGMVPETYWYPVIQTGEFSHPMPDVPLSRQYEAYYADPAEPLTWSLSTTAEWLNINSTSGLVYGSPIIDGRSHWVTITVSDTLGRTDAIRFAIAVLGGGNGPPVWSIVPGDTELVRGDDYRFNVSVFADNSTIIYNLVSEPASGMTVNSGSGVLEWSNVTTGTYAYNLTATDGHYVIWHVFNLTVFNAPLPADRSPQIVAVSAPNETEAESSSLLTFSVDAVNPDGAPLTYEWKEKGATLSTERSFSKRFPQGNHTVVLLIGDGRHSTTRTFNFTVVPAPGPTGPEPVSSFGPGIVIPAVTIMSVMAIGLFAVAATEPGRYRMTTFLLPLYTRLNRDEVLDNELRGMIRGCIYADPGIHYMAIVRRLKLKNGTAAYHLMTLEREGFIRSRNDGRLKRFYPAEMKPAEVPPRLGRLERIIFEAVREQEGMSQREIARGLDVPYPTISRCVNKMAGNGVLRLERQGITVRCYIAGDRIGEAQDEGCPKPSDRP